MSKKEREIIKEQYHCFNEEIDAIMQEQRHYAVPDEVDCTVIV